MSRRSEADGTTSRGRDRFRGDDLGHVFGKLLAASVITLWLSLVAMVGVLLASSEENPTLTVTDFPVYLVIGSWVGIWASLLGYSVWSYRQLRRMRDEFPERTDRTLGERVSHVLAVASGNVDDPTAYEKRLNLTILSLAAGLFFLVGVPIGVVHGD